MPSARRCDRSGSTPRRSAPTSCAAASSSWTSGPSPASTGSAPSPTSGRGRRPTGTTGWSSSGSTRRSSPSSTRSTASGRRRRIGGSTIPWPSTTTTTSGPPSTTTTGRRSTSSTRDGIIRDHHFGEGATRSPSASIQRLLGRRPRARLRQGIGVEAEADWEHLRSPETYLGYLRTERFASPQRRRVRRAPRLRAARSAAGQPLGAGRRVDDRAGERAVLEAGRRADRLTGSTRATRTW